MSEIHRNDGKRFAVNTYREVLQTKKPALLKAEIELLARGQGNYVYLQKMPNSEIKAVFSREPGYLVGEAIRDHFKKHQHIIYTEALPGGQEYLVVIIRSEAIYLDTILPAAAMIDEVSSLLSIEKTPYQCFAFGELPNAAWAEQFQILPKALSETVALDDSLKLLPVDQALKRAGVGTSNAVYGIALLAVVAVLVTWLFLGTKPPETKTVSRRDLILQSYEQSLRSPLPEVAMSQLATMLEKLYTLRGWVAKTVNVDTGNYRVTLDSDGGNINELQKWAQQHQLSVHMKDNGAELTFRDRTQNRVKLTPIQPIDVEISKIISRLSGFSTDKNITIGQSRSVNHIKEANVTVRFANASPSIIRLIGQRLSGLPVKLDNATTRFDGGLITGTIQLTVVGQ